MKHNLNRSSLSNLDLKLLDVKFIAIQNNQTYLTEALQSVRRAKITQIPSLLRHTQYTSEASFLDQNINVLNTKNSYHKSIFVSKHEAQQMNQNENLNTSFQNQLKNIKKVQLYDYLPQKFNQIGFKDVISQIQENVQSKINQKSILKMNCQTKNNGFQSKISDQSEEIEKYIQKIDLIKNQNDLIHKQISYIYRTKIETNRHGAKRVNNIQLMTTFNPNIEQKNKSLFRFSKNDEQLLHLNAKINLQKLNNQRKVVSRPNFQQKPQIKIVQTCRSAILNRSTSLIDQKMKQKLNFYQNLAKNTQYQEQLTKIHKKIVNQNLHKNLENYLNSSGRRIPQFLKKLRT